MLITFDYIIGLLDILDAHNLVTHNPTLSHFFLFLNFAHVSKHICVAQQPPLSPTVNQTL